jgi:hypothetical protein
LYFPLFPFHHIGFFISSCDRRKRLWRRPSLRLAEELSGSARASCHYSFRAPEQHHQWRHGGADLDQFKCDQRNDFGFRNVSGQRVGKCDAHGKHHLYGSCNRTGRQRRCQDNSYRERAASAATFT